MRIYGILGLQKIVDSWYLYVIVKGHKVGRSAGRLRGAEGGRASWEKAILYHGVRGLQACVHL